MADSVIPLASLLVALVSVVMTHGLTDRRERRRLHLESHIALGDRVWDRRSTAYLEALRELQQWTRAYDRGEFSTQEARAVIDSRGYDPDPDLVARLAVFGSTEAHELFVKGWAIGREAAQKRVAAQAFIDAEHGDQQYGMTLHSKASALIDRVSEIHTALAECAARDLRSREEPFAN